MIIQTVLNYLEYLGGKIMNRNEIIGTVIGQFLGYAAQGFIYSRIAKAMNPQTGIIVKIVSRYGIRLIKYTVKYYVRTDFTSEIIFSDAIDATFFAY